MGGRGGSGPPAQNPPNITKPGVPGGPGVPAPGGRPGGGGGGGNVKPSQPGATNPGGVQNPKGGGKGGDGGHTSTPPPPQPWYDLAYQRKQNRRDSKSDYEEDIIKVNPRNWDDGKDYKVNCTRCSAAWEMRQRGYNVVAGKMNHARGDDLFFSIENKWRDRNGQRRKLTFMDPKVDDPTAVDGERYRTREEFKAEFERRILADGDNQRGFVRINWSDGVGHIFNYEVKDGRIEYYEPQVQPTPGGKVYRGWNPNDWFDDVMLEGQYNGHMRVDDLAPQKNLLDDGWVLAIARFENAAPSFNEMLAELDVRYPLPANATPLDEINKKGLEQAFRTAWQQIRSGKAPRIPAAYKNVPELEQAYRDGVAWARRPD